MNIKPKFLLSIVLIFSAITTGLTFAQDAELLKEDFVAAVTKQRLEKMQELIKAGADVNTSMTYSVDFGGCSMMEECSPFRFAIIRKSLKMVKILLQAKSISHTTLNSALDKAVWKGCSAIVEELIKAGADVNTPMTTYSVNTYDCYYDVKGGSPLCYAVHKGYLDVVKVLLQTKSIPHTTLNSALYDAIVRIRVPMVEELIKEGADVNCADYRDVPLILAIQEHSETTGHTIEPEKDRAKIVQLLLNAGAKMDCVAKAVGLAPSGRTPLMLAINRGNGKIIQLLLNAGAKINCVDQDGSTALMEAVKKHYLNAVQLLLKIPEMTKGPFFGFGKKPINFADKDGNTALIIAVKNIRTSYRPGNGYRNEKQICLNSQKIVEALLKTPGIDLYHVNKNGKIAVTLLEKLNTTMKKRGL